MDRFSKLFGCAVVLSLMASGVIVVAHDRGSSGSGVLPAFADYAQMERFISASQSSNGYVSMMDSGTGGEATASTTTRHSETNLQVQGVDEADLVKTDGRCLYIAQGDQVHIVSAYPADQMRNLSLISLRSALSSADNCTVWANGLFLYGQKLVVVAQVSGPYQCYAPAVLAPCYWSVPEERSLVLVYDISNVENPVLSCSYAISGSMDSCRLTNGTVYVLAQHFIWFYQNDFLRPMVWNGEIGVEIAASSIRYDPEIKDPSALINLLAVDVDNCASNHTSLLTGYSSIVYVSENALYLTYQKWNGPTFTTNQAGVTSSSLPSFDSASTTIYKISISGLRMDPTGKADVPGWPLNQFCLDEKDGELRVATTTAWTNMSSGVYVLGADMKRLGALEGIAPGEHIYSARFVGDMLYLVTFRQVDPLIVIDLGNSSSIRVVGQLDLPGFSSYLHPIDPDHLVGLGMLNGSLKLSLFNVTDASHPAQAASLTVPGWSYSAALYDHHAVLYDPQTGRLIIPVTVYDRASWNCSSGVFVFNVSGNQLDFVGVIAIEPNQYIVRTCMIGEFVYTVTGTSIIAASLANLSVAKKFIYSEGWTYYLPLMIAEGGGAPSAVASIVGVTTESVR